MRVHLRTTNPEATAAVGAGLARLLVPGDVVMLTGPLGAGKTRLVQGIAVGLGIEARVTSPTFVLVRRHEAHIPLVHVDAYRLTSASDLLMLDDDVLDPSVITCIEWGDTVRDALPSDRLECDVRVEGDRSDAPRGLHIGPVGAAWTARSEVLAAHCRVLAGEVDGLGIIDVAGDA